MKIKVIDLLVKIANGEAPSKIKYEDSIYELTFGSVSSARARKASVISREDSFLFPTASVSAATVISVLFICSSSFQK